MKIYAKIMSFKRLLKDQNIHQTMKSWSKKDFKIHSQLFFWIKIILKVKRKKVVFSQTKKFKIDFLIWMSPETLWLHHNFLRTQFLQKFITQKLRINKKKGHQIREQKISKIYQNWKNIIEVSRLSRSLI